MHGSTDLHPERSRLIRKLEAIGTPLTDDERHALATLPMSVSTVPAGFDLAVEGDRPERCHVVVEGLTYRYKRLPDGRRQIFSFQVPGDIPELQCLYAEAIDHSISTVVPGKLASVSLEDLHQLCDRFPTIARSLWRDTLIEAAIFREWMVGMGRRDALARVAHLLCETYAKLNAVGLSDASAQMPLTAELIADSLGLSQVHAARALKELKAKHLIVLDEGWLTVQDWQGLKSAGEFDPKYLHVRQTATQPPPTTTRSS